MHKSELPKEVLKKIKDGLVIPAHPLILNEDKTIDQRRQNALTRYYLDAGAGGIAIGVHTTQFSLRQHGLYPQVLQLCSDTIDNYSSDVIVKIAGLTGKTTQAVTEARLAVANRFHAGLLNLAAFKTESEEEILTHCRTVAAEIPIFGFYLLEACGGIKLSQDFWQEFCQIDNVLAIKVAAFDRYQTLDVVHGLIAAKAEDRITLYTGNDDHIVGDLLCPFVAIRDGEEIAVRFKGGLLGHWAIWTQKAVELFECIKADNNNDLLKLDSIHTHINAAVYDAKNNLKGCISGVHEILRRQGFIDQLIFLDENEQLSPGQAEKINQIYNDFPQWTDDAFVKDNLNKWQTIKGTEK
jgi:dihydrodipicolinate synthase/N-acetylneuraminate lyase